MNFISKLTHLVKAKAARVTAAALALAVVAGASFAPAATQTAQAAANLQVHFIDVGQADAMLIRLPNGQNMVIDAGNNADASTVVNYIKGKGITRIDYVIGTHPDEDHIGGLDAVINNFSIGKVYMPNKTHTTQTYQDVINAINAKGVPLYYGKAGVTVLNTTADGKTLKANMVAPVGTSYSDMNDYSIVLRMQYGYTSFLFSGDAETQSETEILNSGQTISANIYKVGHHGSSTSTTQNYLNRINPSVAVISCGLNNNYGHPHQATIDRLKAKGIKIYRTDLQGTIIITTSGSGWLVNKSPWWQP